MNIYTLGDLRKAVDSAELITTPDRAVEKSDGKFDIVDVEPVSAEKIKNYFLEDKDEDTPRDIGLYHTSFGTFYPTSRHLMLYWPPLTQVYADMMLTAQKKS